MTHAFGFSYTMFPSFILPNGNTWASTVYTNVTYRNLNTVLLKTPNVLAWA